VFVLQPLVTMSDSDPTRQRIIASVFDKRNAGAPIQETYVGHIKIWEEAGEDSGRKPRYILLSSMLIISLQEGCLDCPSVASDGSGFIHKSKLNTNGSFSVGKTWKVSELRGIEVVNVCTAISSIPHTADCRTAGILQYHSGSHV
jgi:hypothetical protein